MTNQTVIITGAACGIGRAIADRCLKEGYRVLAVDISTAGLASLAADFPSADLSTHLVDVADGVQVNRFFDSLPVNQEEPSHLINNAGIYLGKNILTYTADDIQRVVAVNCLGAVFFTTRFAQELITSDRRGSIINMASVAGQEGSSDAVYGLSKAALIGFTKSCAMNFAPHIRVNAIAPALVSTSLLGNVPRERVDDYRHGELLKDPILPEDVADTVAFLLSEQSRCYTGAVFDINNGHYRR